MSDSQPRSFTDLLRLWRFRATLARDLDVQYGTVQSWELRNSLPEKYWDGVIASAKKNDIAGVTRKALERAKNAAARPRRRAAAA